MVRCYLDRGLDLQFSSTCKKGLPFAPWCSDRFGRRVTLFGGALLMLAGVGLQAVALSVAPFIGARLLSGGFGPT